MERQDTADLAASKVLRRAHVSKMTRALQKRLALAIEAIDPNIHSDILKRKRPTSSSNEGTFSDSSSNISDPYHSQSAIPGTGLDSSPVSAGGPLFSDELAPRSGSSAGSKRAKYRPISHIHPDMMSRRSNPRGAQRTLSYSALPSWKKSRGLPESSPAMRGQPTLSFVTEVSIRDDDAVSLTHSEEDDSDLPLHSFQVDSQSRQIQSSPPQRYPRTPSPSLERSDRLKSKSVFNQTTSRADDAADLLMLLATSPSPAVNNNRSRMNPPSTPPQRTPLPSSILNTPGGGSNYVGLGAATPGFNFSDFLNVTPSPAQAAWRTPGGAAAGRTPGGRGATQSRRLNFDTLLPPSTTAAPDVSSTKSITGLGMDLGGELVSSQ